jgi:hypothetical protein
MSKILAFLVLLPLIVLLLLKAVAFYEYDTKQRYIKNILDTVAYKVKITGVLTAEECLDIRDRLNKLARFDGDCIKMSYGTCENGLISDNLQAYTEGNVLYKGEVFDIYVKSADVSNLSMLYNLGVSEDESKNLRYVAKAVCRVEYSSP